MFLWNWISDTTDGICPLRLNKGRSKSGPQLHQSAPRHKEPDVLTVMKLHSSGKVSLPWGAGVGGSSKLASLIILLENKPKKGPKEENHTAARLYPLMTAPFECVIGCKFPQQPQLRGDLYSHTWLVMCPCAVAAAEEVQVRQRYSEWEQLQWHFTAVFSYMSLDNPSLSHSSSISSSVFHSFFQDTLKLGTLYFAVF